MALQAEVLELKAQPEGHCPRCRHRGPHRSGPRRRPRPSSSQSGTLKIGDAVHLRPFCGKVKSLINDRGEAVKQAGPGMPVEIIGFDELPNVGDESS